ncbi:uncharacterized protein BKA78DRAFT_175594 [Phyllosticta capitalensis]|uniref:uncharacterized protein n=1 Tax=Phyllosticta capitalensis TaxID=121624 RepID=UPI003131F200
MCSTPKRGNTWCIRNRRDAASSHATLSASHGDDSLPLYHQLVFDIFPSASLMSLRRRRPIHHDEAPSATDTTPYTSNTMFIASAANCAVFAIIIIHVISSWQQKKKKKRENEQFLHANQCHARPSRRTAPLRVRSPRLVSNRLLRVVAARLPAMPCPSSPGWAHDGLSFFFPCQTLPQLVWSSLHPLFRSARPPSKAKYLGIHRPSVLRDM